MKRLAMLGVLVLVLSACAGTGGWAKATADDEQVRADLSQCRVFARTVTDRDQRIDQDIAAARAPDPLAATRVLKRDVQTIGLERQFTRLVDRCMRGRGYVREGEDTSGSMLTDDSHPSAESNHQLVDSVG